jgi:hypothetical protein
MLNIEFGISFQLKFNILCSIFDIFFTVKNINFHQILNLLLFGSGLQIPNSANFVVISNPRALACVLAVRNLPWATFSSGHISSLRFSRYDSLI